MNGANLISSTLGFWHFLFAIAALGFGSYVLATQKGSKGHKYFGYLYCIAMLGLNASAFGIYHLFGRFGVFHWMSIISVLTLLAGMIPMLIKKPKSCVSLLLSFMYWSVMGLYAAFVSETLVRIPDVVIHAGLPNRTFYTMSGIGSGVCLAVGAYFFFRKKSKWFQFDSNQ
ncbi:MAG: hypothetical protein RIC95_11885 [Vicingaceae bacterium]